MKRLSILLLVIAFSACSKEYIAPNSDIPGYQVYSLENWLKSGFPLDTTMMYYQYPDPPVPLTAWQADCLMNGPCKPMTFKVYIPDSTYFKYVK